jgi:hypothetical protein
MCRRGFFQLQHKILLNPFLQHWNLCWRVVGLLGMWSWSSPLHASVFMWNVVHSLIDIGKNYNVFLYSYKVSDFIITMQHFPMLALCKAAYFLLFLVIKICNHPVSSDLLWCYTDLMQNIYGLTFFMHCCRTVYFWVVSSLAARMIYLSMDFVGDIFTW